ncbi:MAG: hypothetical protein ABIL68_15365 [bacterium]
MKKRIRDNRNNRRITPLRLRNAGLIFLTIALSLLSVEGGFHFWSGMFDFGTAVVASSVFELLRLASLVALTTWKGRKRIIGVVLYAGIALFCAVFAMTARHAEILETQARIDTKRTTEIRSRIDTIKTVYAMRMNDRIGNAERDVYYLESLIAKNPGSMSLIRRREQLQVVRQSLLEERDEFLSETSENPELWIEKNAALLGLKIAPIEDEESNFTSLERAVMITWHMDSETARRFVATVFVLAIEVSIILLAVMIEIKGSRDNNVTRNDAIVRYLTNRFDEDDIRMFVEKCRDKHIKEGELLKSSELTVRLRPIRQAIVENGFDTKDLKELFEKFPVAHGCVREFHRSTTKI